MKNPVKVCTCPAYRFPHREGGGACRKFLEETGRPWYYEEARLDRRDRARDINAANRRFS